MSGVAGGIATRPGPGGRCGRGRWSSSQLHFLFSLLLVSGWRADAACRAGTLSGFPAVAGPVAGDVEEVVVEGGAGAPVPGDRPPPRGRGGGAFGAGAFGGALVPPGVVEVGDGLG